MADTQCFSQTVGREFVRQYYTMFGSGPKYVHRFYGNDSIFVRGATVVTGQSMIEKQIEKLNLKDCHTKILAVDAHDTIGGGVVVQVIGEIAMNGGPFRQFVQTFVLAPQNPKKYYVHNDTFRFLDEFSNEKSAVSSILRNNIIIESEVDQSPTPSDVGKLSSVNGDANGEVRSSENDSLYPGRQAPLPARTAANSYAQQSTSADVTHETFNWTNPPSSDEGPGVVSSEHFHDDHAGRQELPNYDAGNESQSGDNARPPSVGKCSSAASEELDEGQAGEINKQQTSWAARVGSKSGGGGGFTQQPGAFPNIQASVSMITIAQSLNGSNPPGSFPPSDGSKPPVNIPPTVVNVPRQYDPSRNPHIPPVGPVSTGQRPPSSRNRFEQHFSPDHQIFVGNLPLDVKQEEVYEKLKPYGNIVECSVVAKPNQTTSPFAFVTFDSVESAKKLLEVFCHTEFAIRNHKVTLERKRNSSNDGRYRVGDSIHNGRMPMNQRGGGGRGSQFRGGSGAGGGGSNVGPFSSSRNNAQGRTFRNNATGSMGSHSQYAGGNNVAPK